MRKVLFILGKLNDLDVEWLLSNGQKQEIPANHTIIHYGKEVDMLYIITQGEFSVISHLRGDKEIARIQQGEIVGEMSFIDSSPPSASVISTMPSVVLAISRQKLARKLAVDSDFASRFYYAIAVMLSDRLRKTVSNLGYDTNEEEFPADEIDLNVLENLSMAGSRFETILKKLSEI